MFSKYINKRNLAFLVAVLVFVPAISFGSSLFFVDEGGNIGLGNSNPAHKLDVSGAMYSRMVTATSSAIDWNLGNVQSLTLSSSPTLTFSNGQAGGEYKLILNQDATGGRTVTWPASVKWPGGMEPLLTTTATSTDTINFVFDGTSYLGFFSLNYRSHAPDTIAFDAQGGTVVTTGSPSSISWNHTVSGSNRALIVFIYNDGGSGGGSDNVTSVTYNGVAMTRVNSSIHGGTRVFAYLLLNPSLGTHPVSVTTSTSQNQLGGVSQSYTGVKQIGQPGSSAVNDGESTSLTISNSVSVANSWIIGATRNEAEVPTAGAGTTLRATANTLAGADSNGPVLTGLRSLNWNISVSDGWTGCALSLAPLSE